MLKRFPLVLAAALLSAPVVLATMALADHGPTTISAPAGFPADVPSGKSGDWKFMANFPMGPGTTPALGTDAEVFVRDGKKHVVVGSMTLGFRIFRYDEVSRATKPVPVADYPSAFPCSGASNAAAILINNKIDNDRDASDTLGIAGWQNDVQVNGDGTLLALATDADGRCHDVAGAGMELVDISDLENPRLFHLTRHFGEAHNLTIDKARGLVYVSSSDTQLNAIDIVDIRSCMPPASDALKFSACRPTVARYQFAVPQTANVPAKFKDPSRPDGLTAGTADKGNNGCHDITVQGDFLYCAGINATVIFDASSLMKRADGTSCVSLTDLGCKLTGTHLTDAAMIAADKDPTVASPGACAIRDGTLAVGKPSSVTDCDVWNRPTSGTQNERYAGDEFMKAGLNNANLKVVSVLRHGGTSTTKPAREDISISHEADVNKDATVLMVTDERGGGLSNICGPGSEGGGGIWFYDIRDKANPKLLKQPDGSNGVFITKNAPVTANCTVHVLQHADVPDRNIIVAGWYSEGTHVIEWDADLAAGTVEFDELGFYVPNGGTPANTWTSAIVGVQNNDLIIQTGDMTRGTDVLAFRLGTVGSTATDAQYQQCGRVFPDPHAYWPAPEQTPARSPWAKGNAACAALDFLQYGDAIAGLEYLESRFGRYVEFYRLQQDFNGGSSTITCDAYDAFTDQHRDAMCSAGLPRQGVPNKRVRSDLLMVRVTDESVAQSGKKLFVFPLSIHGIERAGAEAGARAAEDLAVWAACENGDAGTLVNCAQEGSIPHPLLETQPSQSITAGEALKGSAIYFIFPNPDGWRRGDRDNLVRFYQRYNGNGVDPNRDWPTIGYTFRPYTPASEPETRAFVEVLKGISPKWEGGIDLHGQLIDRAFSFTLLGAGEQDYTKNQRILQTVKGAWADAEARLEWSPLIKPNDAPQDDERLYGVQWGTVWDTIGYTTTGSLGDWINSPLGLNADGIDNEMSLSHISNCGTGSCYLPDAEQLHIDGNKSLVYAMVNFALKPEDSQFRAPGKVGYVFSERVVEEAANPTTVSPGDPQAPLVDRQLSASNDWTFEFDVLGPDRGVHNGGIEAKATPLNFGGVSASSLSELVLERLDKNGEADPGADNGCGEADDDWHEVNRYFNQSSIYLQGGQAVHGNLPLPGRWRVCLTGGLTNAATAGTVDLDITFTREQAWEDPGQVGYRATNMKFFDDLAKHMEPGQLVKLSADDLLAGTASLDGFTSLVIADDALPGFTEPIPTGPAQQGQTHQPPAKAAATAPCAGDEHSPPTCTADYEFDVDAAFNNQQLIVTLTAPGAVNDWDLFVQRQSRISGDWFTVGRSATSTGNERVTLLTPPVGHYRARIVNWAGTTPPTKLEIAFSNEYAGPPVPPSERTAAERDAWGDLLRGFVESGGNLVLTDGAVRNLAYMDVLPRTVVNTFSVYAGYIGFTRDGESDTYSDPLAKDVNQPGAAEGDQHRHQTYEPVPIGYAIQDESGADFNSAPVWAVDQVEWEKAGGRTVGITTPDQVTLGELKLGSGSVRVIGALLPMPTDAYYNPFGVANYALTYTGYQVLLNSLQAQGSASLPPTGGGGGGGGGGSGGAGSDSSSSTSTPSSATTGSSSDTTTSAPAPSQQPAQQPATTVTTAGAPPATQPQQGGVAGATKTVARFASGWGKVGRAWFWLRAGGRVARIKYDDRAGRVHFFVRNARVTYTQTGAVIRGTTKHRARTVRFTAVIRDAKRDTFDLRLSNGYRLRGLVARGGLRVG